MAVVVDQNRWFIGTVKQTRRYRAYCEITVNGVPVTNRLDPFLLSVHVFDGSPFTAEIELDDRDARLPIPPIAAPLQIGMGWASESMIRVFDGFIKEVEHGFGRTQGGRRMWIHGISWNPTSQAKGGDQSSEGEGAPPGQQEGQGVPFAGIMGKVAGQAGLSADVGASIAGMTRDHWNQTNESPLNFASRFADDVGAFTRVEGNKVIVKKFADFNKPAIQAVWGDNLIAWKIHPFAARPAWGGSVQQHFNTQLGQWKEIASSFAGGMGAPWSAVNSIFRLPVPAPNDAQAGQDNSGVEGGAQMAGMGRVTINGEPTATWMGTVTITGARPGVDGTYLIKSAEHVYNRQGYVTILETFPTGRSGDISGRAYTINPPGATPSNSVDQNVPATVPSPGLGG